MILAATDWLTISINLLLVLFVVVCLLMTLMILMQRPKQEGLGAAFGGGMTDQMFGARTTNVLQRGTVWMATLFFVLALTLAILIGMRNSNAESLIAADATEEETAVVEEVEDAPEDGVESIRSLVDELPPADQVPAEDASIEDIPAEVEAAEDGTEETTETEENSDEP